MHPKLRTALSVGVVTSSVAAPLLGHRPQLLRLVATMSTATTAGLSMVHALERPGKMRLPIHQWWLLASQLYRPWFGIVGHGEGVALVALPALAAVDHHARRETLGAWLLLLVANPGVFTTMIAPANRATLRSPTSPTSDAEFLRARWELGHLIRFGCHATAFTLLGWQNTMRSAAGNPSAADPR